MQGKQTFVVVLLLFAAAIWSFFAWFIQGDDAPLHFAQKVMSTSLAVTMAAWLFYVMKIADKLPDHLMERVGSVYYGADGLTFMPTIRRHGRQACLSVYYQNQYEGPVQAIIHLRPPEDSFIIRPGMRDVHIAFQAHGGDYGVIHQPIAVPEHLQGEVIDVKLGAASYYPRSHGSRLRRNQGMPCGSLLVDWGSAFRSGIHEVSGEIDLVSPALLHLSMPKDVEPFTTGEETWQQEIIEAGNGN